MARIEKTVFLSYRRTDFPWALAIYQHLTQHGFDVFFDYSGIASGDFESIILENIRARAHFLVLLTPTALERCVDSTDWLRREIEEAIGSRRNIVPLMLEGFDFGDSTIGSHLTGKLGALNHYNGLGVPVEYFDAAMEKLRGKFLNVPLQAVLHPASSVAQQAAKEQHTAASTDVVTGLINRREFENRMERALENAKARRIEYGVCYLDLDQFNIVNSTLGQIAGNAVLKQIGALLESKMSWRDALARLGGDEFGILLENCSPDEALRTAEEIREAVQAAEFLWENRTIKVNVTIGVVAISGRIQDVSSLLNAAEMACQTGKESGRNRVERVDEAEIEQGRRVRLLQWASRASSALQEGRFVLFRQSILPLRRQSDGAYYELQLRILDKTGHLLAPDTFMSGAEVDGIMPRIDRWVIENALRWLESEVEERARLLMCSINLSEQSIRDDRFLPYVIDEFYKRSLDASKICFEITETAVVASFSQTKGFIQALKQFGCKFALDEFGTGLSSFGYLKHFPVDYLKVDGNFVRNILQDPIDREMVHSINEIAHLTGKQTIADFAESAEIVQMLRNIGVDFAQGNGVARPERILGAPAGE
jgi:diguanylate cyclase (GGDEF)-like protein